MVQQDDILESMRSDIEAYHVLKHRLRMPCDCAEDESFANVQAQNLLREDSRVDTSDDARLGSWSTGRLYVRDQRERLMRLGILSVQHCQRGV